MRSGIAGLIKLQTKSDGDSTNDALDLPRHLVVARVEFYGGGQLGKDAADRVHVKGVLCIDVD